jgi:hypothetical protein
MKSDLAMTGTSESNKPLPDESAALQARRQRVRSVAIAVGLGLLVVMFYAATIVRLGGAVVNRPL